MIEYHETMVKKYDSSVELFERSQLEKIEEKREHIGMMTCATVKIKSAVPYCSCVKQFVYKGTKKKRIILEPTLPKAKINVSLISLAYLVFIFSPALFLDFLLQYWLFPKLHYVVNNKIHKQTNQNVDEVTKPAK